MRTTIPTVCVVAAAAACEPPADSARVEPEAVVETIGDTTVVRTVSGSVWGSEATLVPELSIGELDGAEEYLFGSISSITVDADGRVFVMDGQAGDIRPARPQTATLSNTCTSWIRAAKSWTLSPLPPAASSPPPWRFACACLGRDDGVLRIENAYEPVPTSEAEREYHRERITRSLRRTQPDWSWNGPPVPDTKPPFTGLVAGRDGRIWVLLWTEAHPVDNQNHNPDNPFSDPVVWESQVRYDAFEPDGTYLGTLAAPDGFRVWPEPIFDGDHVWAVTRDELGVERVVRYRLVVGG